MKVEGLGLTLKRNQAYVMKFIMQDYNKLAYVLDQPREFRYFHLDFSCPKTSLISVTELCEQSISLLQKCGQ